MPMYEFVVRVNGRHASFTPVGRQFGLWPKVCTSISVYVFCDSAVVLNALVDVGPGVWEAVQHHAFPPAFPLDWLLLTHAHSDHCLSLDTLCGDRARHGREVGGRPLPPLPVHCVPDTYHDVVGSRMSWLGSALSLVPAVPGTRRFSGRPPMVGRFWTSCSLKFSTSDGPRCPCSGSPTPQVGCPGWCVSSTSATSTHPVPQRPWPVAARTTRCCSSPSS